MSSQKQRDDNRQMQVLSAQYIGPLPPAQQLIQYNQAVPDAAERILKMAEEQSAHRRPLENRVVESDISRANRGLLCALVVTVLSIGCATYLIMNSHDNAGSLMFGTTVVSIVASFIYGTSVRKKERESRSK